MVPKLLIFIYFVVIFLKLWWPSWICIVYIIHTSFLLLQSTPQYNVNKNRHQNIKIGHMVPKLWIYTYIVVISMAILAAILDFRGIYCTYIIFYGFKVFPGAISIKIDTQIIKIRHMVPKLLIFIYFVVIFMIILAAISWYILYINTFLWL